MAGEHAGALYNLAMLTASGDGVEQDPDAAHALMKRAALRGYAAAMNDFAVPYITSQRDDVSYETGLAWMMLAADHGYETAAENMEILREQATPAQLKQAKTILTEQVEPEVEEMRGNDHFVLGYHQYQVTE